MNQSMHYRPDCRRARMNTPQTPPPRPYPVAKPDMEYEMEQYTKEELFQVINEVSFAVIDIQLYLDTHPYDLNALLYFKEQSALRNRALEVYAGRFAPLTIDTANDLHNDSWEWAEQPWPWETKGGGC